MVKNKRELVAENAFLRQQLIVYKRQVRQPKLTSQDRGLLVVLASRVRDWKNALLVVKPETLLKWHRQGFKLFWRRKSKGEARKSRISIETIALIKQMAVENRRWREMLEQIIAGQDDPAQLAQLARGRLRDKIAELERALTGRIRDSHRLLLKLHLEHIDDLNAKIVQLSAQVDRLRLPFDPDKALQRLDAIPGVDVKVAQVILAELGTDMSRFPTAAHAASWAGLAPGRNESAGRNRSSRIHPGNSHLKTALVQAAHAAAKRNDHYLGAQYRRLAARRGKQRAAIAVAHSILVCAYHMLKRGTDYVELGGHYFDKRNQPQLQQRLVTRLEHLGFSVTLQPNAPI